MLAVVVFKATYVYDREGVAKARRPQVPLSLPRAVEGVLSRDLIG
jgi:hypothetical protein